MGYIPRVRLVPRSVPVLWVLAALVCPWAMAFGVFARVTGHGHRHAHPDNHHAQAVEMVLHGHHHEPGIPLHQHTLVATKLTALTTKISLILDPATSVQPIGALTGHGTESPTKAAGLHRGPPLQLHAFSILRI